MSKTLKEMKARQYDLKSEGKAMLDKSEADARDFSAAEEAKFKAIETEIEALSADIIRAEAAADRRRNMEGGVAQNSASSRVEVGVDRASLDPRAGFQSLGEFARAVHRANPQTPNAVMDARLASMYQAAPTGFHREGGSNDGYMVPAEFRDRIWEIVAEQDNLMAEIDAENTSSNQVNDLTDETTPWGTTGVKAYWRSEGSQMNPSRLAANPRSVKLDELYAFVLASDELLEDAPRLNDRLSNKAGQAISWKLDESIIEGNGVGQPLGWMKSNALISVAKEAGQAADTIVAANIAKMYSRLLPASVARAHWRVNSDVLPQLMQLVIGSQTIWTPPSTGFKDAPGGFLLGRPIKFSEHNATLGDKGDIQLVDPKGWYGLKKDGGIKFASSIHLYFDYGIQAFRWTVRFGGQPHLRTPLAPAKGSTTKSHFVTLDDRA